MSRGHCNSLSCNKRNVVVSNLNFGSTSPARGGFQNLQQIKRHNGRQPHPHQTNSTMADNHMHILYLAKTRQLEVVGRQEGKVEPGGRAGQGAAAKTCKLRHAYSQCMFRLLTFACALSVTATTYAMIISGLICIIQSSICLSNSS